MSVTNKGTAIRLSQCMIVKNEEKNIERALTWAKDIAFEQIVVDTGSTDRTVEIATHMGAKLFHFKWIDDFSAAKNYAIDQATGDWIAFLDADEYISPEQVKLIIPVIKKTIKIYAGKAVALSSKWAQMDDNGNIGSVNRQERIFLNHPDIRYERPIHETLKIPSSTFPVKENDIVINHIGYSNSAHAETMKLERNIALLKKALESNPEDIKSKFYLAESFLGTGNIEGAIPLYREVLNETVREKRVYRWFRIRAFYYLTLSLNNIKAFAEAYALAEQAYHEFPDHVNFCCLYGTAMYSREQFKNALAAFEKAEKLIINGKTEDHLLGNVDSLYAYLAQTYIKLNDYSEAFRCAVIYLQSHKQHEDMLKLCIHILRSQESPENAISFLAKIYDYTITLISFRGSQISFRGQRTSFCGLPVFFVFYEKFRIYICCMIIHINSEKCKRKSFLIFYNFIQLLWKQKLRLDTKPVQKPDK